MVTFSVTLICGLPDISNSLLSSHIDGRYVSSFEVIGGHGICCGQPSVIRNAYQFGEEALMSQKLLPPESLHQAEPSLTHAEQVL